MEVYVELASQRIELAAAGPGFGGVAVERRLLVTNCTEP